MNGSASSMPEEAKNDDLPTFANLWDRFREIIQSVADVKALHERIQERRETAEINVDKARGRTAEGHGEDWNELLEAKAEEWERRAKVEQEKDRVLRAMMNYFVASSDPAMPPPRFDELTEEDRTAMQQEFETIRVPKKESEVLTAIRRVLKRTHDFETKTEFYAAVDRERGLSGSGRATERWARQNARNPVPPPSYWRKELAVD
jgi:hypothetical protein